jgi:hypothetical protein
MSARQNQPTPIVTCSIDGCERKAVRRCPWCDRALCDECWCKDETAHARQEREESEERRGA